MFKGVIPLIGHLKQVRKAIGGIFRILTEFFKDHDLISVSLQIHFPQILLRKSRILGGSIETGHDLVKDHVFRFFSHQLEIIGPGPLPFQYINDLLKGGEKLVLVNGLGQIKVHAIADRCLGIGKVRVTAQYYEPSAVALFSGNAHNISTVKPGHTDIQKHQDWIFLQNKLQGLLAVCGFPADFKAQGLPVYNAFQAFSDILFIICNQYCFHRFILTAGCPNVNEGTKKE